MNSCSNGGEQFGGQKCKKKKKKHPKMIFWNVSFLPDFFTAAGCVLFIDWDFIQVGNIKWFFGKTFNFQVFDFPKWGIKYTMFWTNPGFFGSESEMLGGNCCILYTLSQISSVAMCIKSSWVGNTSATKIDRILFWKSLGIHFLVQFFVPSQSWFNGVGNWDKPQAPRYTGRIMPVNMWLMTMVNKSP